MSDNHMRSVSTTSFPSTPHFINDSDKNYCVNNNSNNDSNNNNNNNDDDNNSNKNYESKNLAH